jgi:hypothetical protein
MIIKDTPNKWIPLMVRQAHHERNQQLNVRPQPVEGLVQCFLKAFSARYSDEGSSRRLRDSARREKIFAA